MSPTSIARALWWGTAALIAGKHAAICTRAHQDVVCACDRTGRAS